MPSCRVTNKTGRPLNICLKQVTALHFENEVKSGEEIKFKPGKVWFTLEAVVDDGTKSSRYSIIKSAATIGLLSIAVGAVAVTAGAALLPSAAAAGGAASATAVASTASKASLVSKASVVTKAAIAKNAGTIAKISSIAIPKAVEKISAEVGGLTALQREVVSIISSPTMSSDVRHRATDLLHNLHNAYKNDKDASAEAARAGRPDAADGAPVAADPGADGVPQATRKLSSWNPFRSTATPPSTTTTSPATATANAQAPADPSLAAEASTLDAQLPPTAASDSMVENAPVSSDQVLRVHGIYMDRRRRFEVRVNAHGKLELWDANEGALWSRHKEKQQDEAARKVVEREAKEEKERKKAEKAAGKAGGGVGVGASAVPGAGTVGQGQVQGAQGLQVPDANMTDGATTTDDEPDIATASGPTLPGHAHAHPHPHPHYPHDIRSVTSVELNRDDTETALVREGRSGGGGRGVGRKATLKERLSGLMAPSSASASASASAPAQPIPQPQASQQPQASAVAPPMPMQPQQWQVPTQQSGLPGMPHSDGVSSVAPAPAYAAGAGPGGATSMGGGMAEQHQPPPLPPRH